MSKSFRIIAADHTGITVSNLERSVAFWQDVLGFDGLQVSPGQRATPTEQAIRLAQAGAIQGIANTARIGKVCLLAAPLDVGEQRRLS